MAYDKEEVYDREIAPLMKRIIWICKEHNLPMVATFQYADDEEKGPGYCTTLLPFEGVASNKIIDLANAMKPERPVCIAETHVTNPDGSKTIQMSLV